MDPRVFLEMLSRTEAVDPLARDEIDGPAETVDITEDIRATRGD